MTNENDDRRARSLSLPGQDVARTRRLIGSDIDLVVSIDSFPTGSTRIQSFLSSMAQAVRRRHITNHVVIIGKAKVPIIKFVTTDGELSTANCLRTGGGLGVVNVSWRGRQPDHWQRGLCMALTSITSS